MEHTSSKWKMRWQKRENIHKVVLKLFRGVILVQSISGVLKNPYPYSGISPVWAVPFYEVQSQNSTACLHGAHFSSSVMWNGHVRNMDGIDLGVGVGRHPFLCPLSIRVFCDTAESLLHRYTVNCYYWKFNLWLRKGACFSSKACLSHLFTVRK